MWKKHTKDCLPDDLYYGDDVIIQTKDGQYDGPFTADSIEWEQNLGSGTVKQYRKYTPPDSDWCLYTASLEGSCPVNPDDYVEVELVDGTKGSRIAKNYRWTYVGGASDIVAYKIVNGKTETIKEPTRPVTKLGGVPQKRLLLL